MNIALIKSATLIMFFSFIFCFSGCSTNKERPEFPYSEDQNQQMKKMPLFPAEKEKEDSAVAVDPLLQPGFVLEISNIEDRKLNGSFKVEFDETLHLPYNVVIKTTDLKLSALKNELSGAYRKFFQSLSPFTVQLTKRVYLLEVRGLVEKPGKITIEPHASLEAVISQAGGLSKELPPKYLRIVRKDHSQFALSIIDYFKAGSQFAGLEVKAGDTLYFQVDTPEQNGISMLNLTTIQVMGEVSKPGPLTYQPGKDIYDYLLQAGGPASMADLSRVKIFRGNSQNRLIADLDLMEEEKRPVVKPGDLILVPYDKPTPSEKKISQASNIATIISALALVLITFGVR